MAGDRDQVVEDDVEGAFAAAVDAGLVVGLLVAVEGDLDAALAEAIHGLHEGAVEADPVGDDVPGEAAAARGHGSTQDLRGTEDDVLARQGLAAEILQAEDARAGRVDLAEDELEGLLLRLARHGVVGR